jgi:hypothetical protein
MTPTKAAKSLLKFLVQQTWRTGKRSQFTVSLGARPSVHSRATEGRRRRGVAEPTQLRHQLRDVRRCPPPCARQRPSSCAPSPTNVLLRRTYSCALSLRRAMPLGHRYQDSSSPVRRNVSKAK